MTLQLAVKITGDASSLTQATREATSATQGMSTAVQAAGGQARATTADLDRAAAATRGLAAASVAAQAQAAAAGGRTGGSMGAAQGASGFRPDQWKNLGFQANDIATSLASGIPITQVLAQQGGQVAQVLGDAPGGIAGGLKIVADRALSILTPIRLVTGGFVGLSATVAALGVSWARSQEDIERGLTGIGRMSGARVADINRIAESASAGNLLSTGQARGVATAIASTGKVDVSNIGSVAALAPGYARLMGKDVEEAGTDLARIFSDPVKGADELNSRIGGLNESTRSYIRTLVEQGQRQQAIQVLVRAFAPDIQAAVDKTSAWARAWNGVKSAAQMAGEFVARPFVTGSTEDQLKEAERDLLKARSSYGIGFGADEGPEVAAKRAVRDRLKQQLEAEQARPGKLASAELSKQADEAVRALTPEIASVQSLTDSLKLLEKTQNDLDALAAMTAQGRANLFTAMEAARGGVESDLSAAEKARASEALTIRSIEARTVAEKAAIAAERERQGLAGKAVEGGAAERRLREEAARQAVLAQSTRDSQDRLRTANDNAAAAGLSPYQRQLAEFEARQRRIFEGDRGNPKALADDRAAKAAERAAIDKEAIGAPIREANRAVAEQVSALKLQQDAFGASTEAAERMAAALRLTNQFAAAGIPITSDLKKAIDGYASASGKVAAAQEDLIRRQREVVGGLDDVRSGLRGGVNGLFSDLAQGRNPLDNIASAAGGIASRITDRTVTTPLINGLFGQEGKAGGGMFGDALGGIFGKAAGLSTADITAGIVNLSGPLSGAAGLGGTVTSALGGGTGTSTSAQAASGILSGLTGSRSDVAEYVRQAAASRGIDPNVALRVINQESGFNTAARNVTSKEASYGVMQLNTMGGLGTEALKAGIDPRDPSAWRSQVDFGLDVVKKDGWRQWYGARDIGVSRWEGIGQGGPSNTASSAAAPLAGLEGSLKAIGGTATTSAQGVDSLAGNLASLPGPLAQTSDGLDKVGSSLGSGGGGLLAQLASLFGGGGGASAPTAVAAAGGGHIRGPGTSTSDSIPAWLSDGEFVVNASATKKHLPLLQALNENRRMAAFAEGGLVGMAVPPAARQEERQRQSAASAASGEPNVAVQVVNNVGADVNTTAERAADGRLNLKVMIDRQVADLIGRPGSRTGNALRSDWGLSRSMKRR